jgi:hypothetical protein
LASGVVFGFLQPLLFGFIDINTSIYASIIVRSIAGVLFVIDLVPAVSPRFTRRALIASLVAFIVLGLIVVQQGALLPHLARLTEIEIVVAAGDAPLRGLTLWHWAFSLTPLALAVVADLWAANRDGAVLVLTGSAEAIPVLHVFTTLAE